MLREWMVVGEPLIQPGHGLRDLLLMIGLSRVLPVLLQRQVQHRPSGGPAHAQVDPARSHRFELLEHLRDLERAVVVHQHRPGPQSDAGRAHRGGRDQQLRMVRGARAAHVVFGEPDWVR